MFRVLFMIFIVFVFTANAKEMSGFFGGAELGLGYAELKTKETPYQSVKTVSGGGQTTTTTITDMEILDSRKQSWSLALRYIYSF